MFKCTRLSPLGNRAARCRPYLHKNSQQTSDDDKQDEALYKIQHGSKDERHEECEAHYRKSTSLVREGAEYYTTDHHPGKVYTGGCPWHVLFVTNQVPLQNNVRAMINNCKPHTHKDGRL